MLRCKTRKTTLPDHQIIYVVVNKHLFVCRNMYSVHERHCFKIFVLTGIYYVLCSLNIKNQEDLYREKICLCACRYLVGNVQDLLCHFIVKIEIREFLRVSKYQVTLHFVKRTTDAFVRKWRVEDVAAYVCLSCEVALFYHFVAWLSDLW